MGPAGFIVVDEEAFSDDGGVGAVGAIEVDAFPIDELVAGVDGGEAHRVVIVDGPSLAFGNTAGSGVEPDCEAFLGDVDVLIDGAGFDLVGAEEEVSKVHLLVGRRRFFGFLFLDLGDAARKGGEVGFVDFAELGGVMLLEVFLADVVDDIVLLAGRELRHRHHHAVSLGEGLIHAEGIVAVLEFSFVEFKGNGNGTFDFLGAVAGDAKLVVDFFSSFQGI